jgi:omega-6 fatty acid desaturase (delta-12 desaturase)
MSNENHDDQTWRKLLAPYKNASWGRALFQLFNTLIPFALIWGLMAWNLDHLPWLNALLVIPLAVLFTRLFIFQHDCGHGAFFPSRRANNFLGGLLGVITLFPYGYWRRTHAIHHATAGNLDQRELGDIHTLTVSEYQAKSRWGRFGYRLYRNPFVLFGFGPAYQFVIKHRFPWDIPFSWKREWKSVLGTNLALAVAFSGLGYWLGWQTVALVHLPLVVAAGALGVWLFYVQHQFEETYWDTGEGWDFYRAGAHGSSFYDLPPFLHWLTGNIGYHHIHHLSSQIPNYRLAQAFRENPSLQKVTRIRLWESFRCARLKLWDEESRSLIGFRELAALVKEREAAPEVRELAVAS